MGSFIVLQDGRAWGAASWAYDAVIRSIADALPETAPGQALAALLRQRTCYGFARGAGDGYSLDVRALTTQNQRLFTRAAQRAFTTVLLEGPVGWGDPSFYPAWLDWFRLLMRMMRCVRRREPPEWFRPRMGFDPDPPRERAGPGWDEEDL